MEQRMDPLKWKCCEVCWVAEGTGWWRVESWKSCPLISGTTCCYPLWTRRKEGEKSGHVCRKCHMTCRMSHCVRYFVIYLYIFLKNNRRRSMATQQRYVRELWVELFLKHDDSWSNNLMWPDIMCTLSADFFCWTKASFWFNLTEQNTVAQRTVPCSLLSAILRSPARIPDTKDNASSLNMLICLCRLGFWGALPAQQSVNWELG